ncbi:Hha/YmoA family nucleoid-associated regulatory protein [Klebsiella pneumoniae]|nr:Hha/YmoA family nucleoid-associated regulatory protein [Klebsiella pneumoniae]
MLYAAADYRRAEIVINQYFDKVPGNGDATNLLI